MRFTARADTDQAKQDAETVARLRAAMDAHWQSHGPGTMIALSYVRDLLNPRGMWSVDPEYRRSPVGTAQGPAQETDPELDPVTGCKPVTP